MKQHMESLDGTPVMHTPWLNLTFLGGVRHKHGLNNNKHLSGLTGPELMGGHLPQIPMEFSPHNFFVFPWYWTHVRIMYLT